MSEYSIVLSKQAEKSLKEIPIKERLKIAEKISSLSEDPRPPGTLKLTNRIPSQYRIRQGNYRILFHINDKIVTIEIIDIDHRKKIYDKS